MADRRGAEVIEAPSVVVMLVRNADGIEVVYVVFDELATEVGTTIDENITALVLYEAEVR